MLYRFTSHHTAPMIHNLTFEFEAQDYNHALNMIYTLFGRSLDMQQPNVNHFVDNMYEFVHDKLCMFFTLQEIVILDNSVKGELVSCI